MKKLAAAALAVILLSGCGTATPQGPSEADKRYEKCAAGATDDYRVKYGEAHYRDNETKVKRMIQDRCENARK